VIFALKVSIGGRSLEFLTSDVWGMRFGQSLWYGFIFLYGRSATSLHTSYFSVCHRVGRNSIVYVINDTTRTTSYILTFATRISDLDFQNPFRSVRSIFQSPDNNVSDEYLKGLVTYLLLLRTPLALSPKTKVGV
jgi:hypothetical protein